MSQNAMTVPRMALLGITDRARYAFREPMFLSSLDALNLRLALFPLVYPLDLAPYSLVIAVYGIEHPGIGSVVLRDQEGKQLYAAQMAPLSGPLAPASSESPVPLASFSVAVHSVPSWTPLVLPLQGVVPSGPQEVGVFADLDGKEEFLGAIVFGVAERAPMTPDLIAALRADPRAIKAACYHVGCKKCGTELRVLGGFDRPQRLEPGLVWYEDLPDVFECRCGLAKIDLRSLRRHFLWLLGTHTSPRGNITLEQMYEVRALEQVSREFLALIDKSPREEEVQQFIANNPVLLSFLSPTRLFMKPWILSKYKADFGVLDARGMFVLIEIERPEIKILRGDGAAAQEAEHAMSQVQDWLFLHDEHRAAVLTNLGMDPRQVTRTTGLVIGGRDRGNDPEKLRRFKWQDRGRIEFMTYDDILSNLTALGRSLRAL